LGEVFELVAGADVEVEEGFFGQALDEVSVVVFLFGRTQFSVDVVSVVWVLHDVFEYLDRQRVRACFKRDHKLLVVRVALLEELSHVVDCGTLRGPLGALNVFLFSLHARPRHFRRHSAGLYRGLYRGVVRAVQTYH